MYIFLCMYVFVRPLQWLRVKLWWTEHFWCHFEVNYISSLLIEFVSNPMNFLATLKRIRILNIVIFEKGSFRIYFTINFNVYYIDAYYFGGIPKYRIVWNIFIFNFEKIWRKIIWLWLTKTLSNGNLSSNQLRLFFRICMYSDYKNHAAKIKLQASTCKVMEQCMLFFNLFY